MEEALANPDILLLDQANCEKKAAATAVSLLHRFNDERPFTLALSRIAREELKHLELVSKHLDTHAIAYRHLTASRYASALQTWMSKQQPTRAVDQLLVCAMIEARSFERIGTLLGVLHGDIRQLYTRLHDAEDRHFEFYASKAWELDARRCERRLGELRELDAELISSEDVDFRFHSGVPVASA